MEVVEFGIVTAVTLKYVVFSAIKSHVRFLVFTVLTTKNAVFWDAIFVTLMMEAIRSSETSVLTRPTRQIPKTAFFIVTALKTSNLT
jgi:hypothetical protein